SPRPTEMALNRTSKLTTWFPQAQHPIIISAPMLGTSNATLAAEVSKAGGIGIIPAGFNFAPSSPHLSALDEQLTTARTVLDPILPPPPPPSDAPGPTPQPPPLPRLPVGVGFILCDPARSFARHFLATALPLLRRHRPAAVWLFAPLPEDEDEDAAGDGEDDGSDGGDGDDGTVVLARVVAALKREGFLVMVQVGTVASAARAVAHGADVLVVQGVDAGGHQFAAGAGVVSLVPEVADWLRREGKEGEVVVVAAGGIVDGRGVAAALALGAEAVVMGTRFIAAEEAWTPEFRKKLILEATDGGPSTVKTSVLDDIQSTAIWPGIYDGRGLIGKSWQDHLAGMSVEENIRLFKEADKAGDTSRKITWAGTGVGLVRDVRPAGDIVREARQDAIDRIRRLQSVV
ncbi:uncharacterized protein THITE_49067, partial [Thermothielavioides terrestris NRRL 8126]